MLFLLILHGLICALLITVILIQAGRGGGLVDAFSGVESVFGTKTNAFLTRTTTVLSVAFFITCLTLALLSARQSRSLMRDVKTKANTSESGVALPQAPEEGVPIEQIPAQEAPKAE